MYTMSEARLNLGAKVARLGLGKDRRHGTLSAQGDQSYAFYDATGGGGGWLALRRRDVTERGRDQTSVYKIRLRHRK